MAANQFLSLPAAAAGVAPVSGGSAWAFGTAVVLSSSTTTGMRVLGLQFQNTDIPALDTGQDILFEITVNEVTKLQIPFNMKADTLVGYVQTSSASIQSFYLPEPYYIPSGSSVWIKVTDSIAAALTYSGVKLIYEDTGPLFTQAAYRFYEDGTETASTAIAAQNTNITENVDGGDQNIQVRIRLQSTGAVGDSTDDYQLQVSVNGGSYENVV